MKRINFFKKIFYSITNKKYKEMVEEKSGLAILYLAIFELTFTVVLSFIVAKNFFNASFMDIYEYANTFLVDFIDNSLSLTFNTILVLSVIGYLYCLITKSKVKYSKMFCLATYASTLSMILKYVILIVSYTNEIEIPFFNYIYAVIVVIYFILNFKKVCKSE